MTVPTYFYFQILMFMLALAECVLPSPKSKLESTLTKIDRLRKRSYRPNEIVFTRHNQALVKLMLLFE